jgi:putative YhbY family RNA-binding protein
MAELNLPQETVLALRARAHRLEPVVRLGAAGLSEAALREIDRALTAHGLVKIRAGRLEREERDALFARMAQGLEAAKVQVIGHTFVLFRPVPEEAPKSPGKTARTPHSPHSRAARGSGAGGEGVKRRR